MPPSSLHISPQFSSYPVPKQISTYLQRAVEFFIELPSLEDRQMGTIHLFQYVIESLNGATQSGAVGKVELKSMRFQYFTTLHSLLFSLGGKFSVVPSRPLLEFVMLRLSVSNYHQRQSATLIKIPPQIKHYPIIQNISPRDEFGGIKIINMKRKDSRSKETHHINPEDYLSAPQSLSFHSNQLREEKLNAQLLRIKTQYLHKYVEQAWEMEEQQLMQFFNKYQSLSQVIDIQELMNSDCKLVRTQSKIFIGQIRAKKKHGIGVTIYRQGRIYEGSYVDNQKSGLGCEVYANGNLYIGQYHQNKKHGRGTFFWFSLCDNSATKDAHIKVEQYEGTWWGGLPDGEGQHQKTNGDFYLGHFKNGLKHGQGVEYYFNGDKFKGEFVNGLPQGFGEYTWQDGSFYRGDFKQGFRNGYGVWNDVPDSSECYKGHYMLDKKHGYGVYDWANGYLYKGNFFEDQRCGQGQLYYHHALVYQGFWINGERCDEEEYLNTQNGTKDNHSKASTKVAESHNQKRSKSNPKGRPRSKEKKEQQSFIVNFKQSEPLKSCKRGCYACKCKQKRSKSKQRKSYVISRGK